MFIYRGMGDLKKPHCRSQVSDPMYQPSNENGNCETMKVLLNCSACYKQSDWLKKVITVFIIIHEIR